ncbi:hypothetical protein OSTOST_22174, partial [Ostertagia ostertagi]
MDRRKDYIHRYSIEQNDYLEVEPESGVVRLKKLLEPNSLLRLKVTAKEDGQQGMETVEELRVRAQQRDVAEEQVNGDLCNGKVYLATIKEGEPDFEEPLVIRLSKPT